jgi:hypothetical protein
MPQNTTSRVQVGFRVDRDLYDELVSQAFVRGLSNQELIVKALKLFFQTPKDPRNSEATIIGFTGMPAEEMKRRSGWLDVFLAFTEEMPREKTEIFVKAMQWDLSMKKASRRKEGPGRSKKGLEEDQDAE